MFATLFKKLSFETQVREFCDGDRVPAIARVMPVFTVLTYGSKELAEINVGDVIWVGCEMHTQKYFKRHRVTAVELLKNGGKRVRYGEYFFTFSKEYPPRHSLDGLICVVADEAKLRRLST